MDGHGNTLAILGDKYDTVVCLVEGRASVLANHKHGAIDKSGNLVIDIRFDGFGDSSVNLVVVLYTTVDTHYTFPARAKEAIYKAFNENGIEIPFPQRDVYVKSVPFDPAGKE